MTAGSAPPRTATAKRSQISVSDRPGDATGKGRGAPPSTSGGGAKLNSAQTRVSKSGLCGLVAEPLVPSMCHRGSACVVVVLISTRPTAPESKSITNTRTGFAGHSNLQT
jgi:hypothetical protein